MFQADEGRAMQSVEQQLLQRFGDRLDKDTICAEVQTALAALADARVRTFVPVLAQRRAADRLRHRSAA